VIEAAESRRIVSTGFRFNNTTLKTLYFPSSDHIDTADEVNQLVSILMKNYGLERLVPDILVWMMEQSRHFEAERSRTPVSDQRLIPKRCRRIECC
jgi:hypothetical protein